MATAQKAIDQIAEVTGLMPATVGRAARWLREYDVSLWPQGEKGRGREAHVEAHHLVNVVLALAAADPITGAPEVVAELRGMVLLRDDYSAHARPVVTFGQALDQHLTHLARSEDRGKHIKDWWHVTVFGGLQFHARTLRPNAEQHPYNIYLPRRFEKMSDMRASLLQKEATIKHQLILVLADLYGDTLEHRARLLAKAKPERRKTVINPIKRSGAAPGRVAPLRLDQHTD